jgi:hypothetical protein
MSLYPTASSSVSSSSSLAHTSIVFAGVNTLLNLLHDSDDQKGDRKGPVDAAGMFMSYYYSPPSSSSSSCIIILNFFNLFIIVIIGRHHHQCHHSHHHHHHHYRHHHHHLYTHIVVAGDNTLRNLFIDSDDEEVDQKGPFDGAGMYISYYYSLSSSSSSSCIIIIIICSIISSSNGRAFPKRW